VLLGRRGGLVAAAPPGGPWWAGAGRRRAAAAGRCGGAGSGTMANRLPHTEAERQSS